MTVEDLIHECIEALTYCDNSRDEHRRQIGLALASEGLPDNVIECLKQLDQRLGLHNSNSLWSMFPESDEQAEFLEQIHSLVADLNLPRYAYHGTTAGRLPSIYKEGLVPGKLPVWKGSSAQDALVRQNSDSGVFFSSNWRSALHNWALIAHLSSRGPKASIKRAPAVIRIRTDQLSLESDPVATQASLMVRGVVPTDTAEAIIGFDTSFPIWRPLAEVCKML